MSPPGGPRWVGVRLVENLCSVIGSIVIIFYTRIIFQRVLRMGQLNSGDVSG